MDHKRKKPSSQFVTTKMKRFRDSVITEEETKRMETCTDQQETLCLIKGCLLCMPPEILIAITEFLLKKDTLALYRTNKQAQYVTPLDAFDFPHYIFLVRVLEGNLFDNSLDKVHSITWFDGDINQLKKLPDHLEQLTLDWTFNQPIAAGVLPNSLTQLIFDRDFNQQIAAGVLTGSLTQLTFGFDFNQQIVVGVLPDRLTQLTFGARFNQPITEGVLPDSLT
jgi:hypothetical protein